MVDRSPRAGRVAHRHAHRLPACLPSDRAAMAAAVRARGDRYYEHTRKALADQARTDHAEVAARQARVAIRAAYIAFALFALQVVIAVIAAVRDA